MFQNDTLADLSGTGADQTGGNIGQLLPTGNIGSSENADKGDGKGNPCKTAAEQIGNRCEVVDFVIGKPEDLRQCPCAEKETDPPAKYRCTSGVQEIFSHNGTVSESHGFQYTDLRPFFVYHPGHGGNAY